MLHVHELAMAEEGAPYQPPGDKGFNKRSLEGQTSVRAVPIEHGDWPKELNDYSNQIINFIRLFQAVDAPNHILEDMSLPEH